MECHNTAAEPHTHLQGRAVGPNPLAVLKLVMAHCKRMQERMMGQLAAAENRHRRVRGNAHSDSHQSSDQLFYTAIITHGLTQVQVCFACGHACVFVSATDLAYSSEADREGMWSFSTPKLWSVRICVGDSQL